MIIIQPVYAFLMRKKINKMHCRESKKGTCTITFPFQSFKGPPITYINGGKWAARYWHHPASGVVRCWPRRSVQAIIDSFCCHIKLLPTCWLKPMKFILPQLWGQKSQISITESKSRCQLDHTLSRGTGGVSVTCLVQLLITTGTLWHVATSPQSLESACSHLLRLYPPSPLCGSNLPLPPSWGCLWL